MKKKALVQLIIGLCFSNSVMMAAWYILLPIPLPLFIAIVASWGMACIEYAFHVTANRASYNKLGLIRLRGTNEIINMAAFLGILFITQQPLYWKYGVEILLVSVVATFFLIIHGAHKKWLYSIACIAIVWCVVTVLWFPTPTAGKITNVHQIVPGISPWFESILPGGMPVLFFIGALFANAFMILAWYSHVFINNPPLWFRRSSLRKHLYAYLVSIGIAFLEYCILIPVARASYQFVSMMALYGYMEITTVTVFLLFAYLRTRKHTDRGFRLNFVHVIGLILLALIESTTGIF